MKARDTDRFRVDEQGFTVDGYRRLDPVSRKSMYVRTVIADAIVLAIVLAISFYAEKSIDGYPIMEVGMVLSAIIIIYMVASPEIRYRRYRYRLDDDKVEIRKGLIIITHSLVPIERIHQVDVSADPINRFFGLANVTITTAGGVVTIDYLQEEVAESIASRLNDTVVGILRKRV